MEYNLYSPNGTDPLHYPHWTKWTSDNVVNVVNNPKTKLKVNDVVFVATENKLPNGDIEYAYFIGMRPCRVTDVIEERKAHGLHKTDFEPIFQKIKVERIAEQK